MPHHKKNLVGIHNTVYDTIVTTSLTQQTTFITKGPAVTLVHDQEAKSAKEKQKMISVWFERMQQKTVTLWCQICLYKILMHVRIMRCFSKPCLATTAAIGATAPRLAGARLCWLPNKKVPLPIIIPSRTPTLLPLGLFEATCLPSPHPEGPQPSRH